MKKLIAIAVVFVLAVGIAFAADIGAEVLGMTNIIMGDTIKDTELYASTWPGGFKRGRVFASGQNEEGNFGAWFRFEVYGVGNPGLHGYGWWQPLDQIKLTIGVNPDGFYGRDGVAGWGYYQVAGDVGIVKEFWDFGNSFYGAWGKKGALLEIKPIDPLLIWFGVPFGEMTAPTKEDDPYSFPQQKDKDGNIGWTAKDTYQKLHAQVAYNLGSIGEIAVTYTGGFNKLSYNSDKSGVAAYSADASKLYAYFGLKAIDNLGIDLGVGYTLPVKKDKYTDKAGKEQDLTDGSKNIFVTYNNPVAIGLGIHFTAGDLGIKARVQGKVGGSIKAEKAILPGQDDQGKPTAVDTLKLDTEFVFDLMPYFAVTDKVTAHLDTGLGLKKSEWEDSVIAWHIEPYVTVKASWWAPNFYAGIRFETDGKKVGTDQKVPLYWNVPIGIAFAF